MSEKKEKTETAAPEKVADSADQKKVVKVKNISGRNINTSKGVIEAGKTGEATIAELRSYGAFLKKP